MSKLTAKDIERYERDLRARQAQLRERIRDMLLETKRDDFIELAGRVHDRAEEAVADLLASTNITMLDREVAELRDVEDALARIRAETYGTCETCGEPIQRERLGAYPSARHCIDCERRQEIGRAGGRDQTPSL